MLIRSKMSGDVPHPLYELLEAGVHVYECQNASGAIQWAIDHGFQRIFLEGRFNIDDKCSTLIQKSGITIEGITTTNLEYNNWMQVLTATWYDLIQRQFNRRLDSDQTS